MNYLSTVGMQSFKAKPNFAGVGWRDKLCTSPSGILVVTKFNQTWNKFSQNGVKVSFIKTCSFVAF